MAGKNIYIEKMLAEVSQDLSKTVDAIQQLYNATGIKGSKVYSNIDSSIAGRRIQNNDWFGWTVTTGGNTFSKEIRNGFKLRVATPPAGWTSKIEKTIDLRQDEITKIEFDIDWFVWPDTGFTATFQIGSITVDLTEVVEDNHFSVDISRLQRTLTAKFTFSSTDANVEGEISILNMEYRNEAGDVLGLLLPANFMDQVSSIDRSLCIRMDMYANFVLVPPTLEDVIVKWDNLEFMVSDPTHCKLRLMEPNGVFGKEIKSGEMIDINDSQLYIYLHLWRDSINGPNVYFRTLSYRYLK